MARIRTIKPEFWTDEKIGALKRDVRLLFIGLLNLADDEGVLKAVPAFIKGQIFPYDDELRNNTVKDWLDTLEKARMLIPFTLNGESYYIIRTFKSHQTINRPTASKIPLTVIKKAFEDNSLPAHGQFNEDSRQERKGKEGKGREEIHGYVRDSDLENSILNYFGFNEYANHDKARAVNEFIACLFNNQSLEAFKAQFTAYRAYKDENGYPHSFQKFIGNQSCLFTDGAWNAENWQKKLTDFKKTAKPETASEVYVRPKSKKHL